MKKDFGKKTWFFPMPVLVIGSYDIDGNANAMTAAWGGIVDYNMVEINLDPSHKSCDNIFKTKAFTVAFATKETIAAADYLGMVSGNEVSDKINRAGLTTTKSSNVNAPIINEFPVTLECNALKMEYVPDGLRLVGEIINVCADEEVLTNGNIDLSKMHAVGYNPVDHTYYTIGDVCAKAFNVGKSIDEK